MPNAIAYLTLFGFPLLAYLLFRMLPPARAVIWTILIGYLALPPVPTVADIPLLPVLTKIEMPSLAALLMLLWFHGLRWLAFPRSKIVLTLAVLYCISPIATVLANTEAIHTGFYTQQALRVTEIPSIMVSKFLFLLPTILAFGVLNKPGHLKDLLIAMLIGMAFYSIPMLLEIRLSPQINVWVYGFFQHEFAQMIRGNGFRPIVFLYHALWVAFLTLTVAIAALALYRHSEGDDPLEGGVRHFSLHPLAILGAVMKKSPRSIYLALGIYFTILLVLCRSYGAIIYGMALLPLVLMASPRTQITVAFSLAVLVATYPLARATGLFPAYELVEIARDINPIRAQSLEFRFQNEDLLMERASEKWWLGWGTWGRNMPIYGLTGEFLTVSDGRWIITLGQFGILGFVAEMGLFLFPIFAGFAYVLRGGMVGMSPYIPALLLISAVNAVDMLPNATITPLSFLFTGALLRHLEQVPERRRATRQVREARLVTPYLPRRLPGPRTVL